MEVPKYIYHVIRSHPDHYNGDGPLDVRGSYWTLKEAHVAVKAGLQGIAVLSQKICRKGEGEEDTEDENEDEGEDEDEDEEGYGTDLEIYARGGEDEVWRVYIEKKPAPPMPFLIAKPPPALSSTLRPSKVYIVHQTIKLYHDMDESVASIVGDRVYDTLLEANEAAYQHLRHRGQHPDNYSDSDGDEDTVEGFESSEGEDENRGSSTLPYSGRIYHVQDVDGLDDVDTLEVHVGAMYVRYAKRATRKRTSEDEGVRDAGAAKKARTAGVDGVIDLSTSSP